LLKVLTGTDFTWHHGTGGRIFKNAVVAGTSANLEKLYICRGRVLDSLSPGKMMVPQGPIYIGHSWKQHIVYDYEVLLLGKPDGK
jgi:hypothetical protein